MREPDNVIEGTQALGEGPESRLRDLPPESDIQAHILVVDDEQMVRDVVCRALTQAGHQCTAAADGDEALALAARNSFDLVVTDLVMPRVNGLQLIESLRKEHPDLPVIIITGHGDLESARQALLMRVSDYLVKPFQSLVDVQAAVQRALQPDTSRRDTESLAREFDERTQERELRERPIMRSLDRAARRIGAVGAGSGTSEREPGEGANTKNEGHISAVPPRSPATEEPHGTGIGTSWFSMDELRGKVAGSAVRTEPEVFTIEGYAKGASEDTVCPDLSSQLARLAVEGGMAGSTEVRSCLDAMARAHEQGLNRPLAELLVEKGVLSEEAVHALVDALRQGDSQGRLGNFQLLCKIGEGGMGSVHKARHIVLDRIVALKILPPRLASNIEFLNRFLHEARSAASLDHPNVVRAVDAGEAGGKFYFAMEFVEGPSVEQLLEERGMISEDEALQIVTQAARGLECAWLHQMVHRDIKPDNILISRDGVARIADLGLVKSTEIPDATRLTQEGCVMGSPHYISPEQARGEEVDIRTDIYSLGATLYRMVTGEFPFPGKDPVSIILARFHESPKPVSEVNPGVSAELARVIDTMMACDREDRYPDPAVLLHDLEQLAEGRKSLCASKGRPARERPTKGARSRRTGKVRPGPVDVKRRGIRNLTIAGVAAAAVALAFIAALIGLQAPPTAPTMLEDRPPASARQGGESGAAHTRQDEDVEALETEAAELYEALLVAYRAKDLTEVAERIDAVGAKYESTPHSTELDALRRKTAARLEENARRAAAEAERERRFRELLRLAREELDVKDYATALSLLSQAGAIRQTEEVERLVKKARRIQHLTRAAEAERAGRLSDALRLLELALAIKDAPELHEHLVELRRREALKNKLSEAQSLAAEEVWHDARDAYLRALELARGDEAPGVKRSLEVAEREIGCLEALEKALAFSDTARWREALTAAREAASIKPDSQRARDLIRAARRALGPEKETTSSTGMTFVLVPAGQFLMGSDSGDPDERPRRRVHLDAYYIGKYEVTNAQFEVFDPAHKSRRPKFSPEDGMPAVAVSWEDAVAFCRWLSEKEGIEYRLPTEAEWEKAARGTDGRAYPWGGEAPAEGGRWRCNIAAGNERELWAEDGYEYASPVGTYPEGASPFGALDLAGNVWEWCLDWYRSDYYSSGEARNPTGPASGEQRVLRGGSFGDPAREVRCTIRTAQEPGFVEAAVGFRCVRALAPVFQGNGGEGDR